jgi:hypothetical protein
MVFIDDKDRDCAVNHKCVVHYISIGIRCANVGMIVKEKGAPE